MTNKHTTWPELEFSKLKDTIATLQLWTQIVGKIRLKKSPWLNHSWHVTLYVYPRGLTTHSIPNGNTSFQLDFDFIAHQLIITCSSGDKQVVELYPRTVASFYKEVLDKLAILNIDVSIYAKPNEIDPAIPFAEDEVHKSYNKEQVTEFFKALSAIDPVFTKFRSRFSGKCSPVHFFWGAFDLAVTRFSGRRAPLHPGGAPNMPDVVMQEAYSHEVSSCGFWPGSEQFPHPAFYAYCYPTPADFGSQPVKPAEAFYSTEMGEFFLKYDDVRTAADPEKTLLDFLETTYTAAANTGNWDRAALECDFSWLEKP
ncbi:MAG TPA: DUF5996 family protein [Mucilaginibacter sp.]|nr:DUF5996 family protein [Mucilaginibacter sp.]